VKLIVSQPVQKIAAFSETQRIIADFTSLPRLDNRCFTDLNFTILERENKNVLTKIGTKETSPTQSEARLK
jgi:hypothetical protein